MDIKQIILEWTSLARLAKRSDQHTYSSRTFTWMGWLDPSTGLFPNNAHSSASLWVSQAVPLERKG